MDFDKEITKFCRSESNQLLSESPGIINHLDIEEMIDNQETTKESNPRKQLEIKYSEPKNTIS